MSSELLALLNNPDCPNEVIRDWLEERGHPVATVFIVVGQTGEYSDRMDWYVCASLVEEAAEAVKNRLNAWCVENRCNDRSMPYDDESKPPDDPLFRNDYTGTKYSVFELPLRGDQ